MNYKEKGDTMLKLMSLPYRRYFLKYSNIKHVICLHFSFCDKIFRQLIKTIKWLFPQWTCMYHLKGNVLLHISCIHLLTMNIYPIWSLSRFFKMINLILLHCCFVNVKMYSRMLIDLIEVINIQGLFFIFSHLHEHAEASWS